MVTVRSLWGISPSCDLPLIPDETMVDVLDFSYLYGVSFCDNWDRKFACQFGACGLYVETTESNLLIVKFLMRSGFWKKLPFRPQEVRVLCYIRDLNWLEEQKRLARLRTGLHSGLVQVLN